MSTKNHCKKCLKTLEKSWKHYKETQSHSTGERSTSLLWVQWLRSDFSGKRSNSQSNKIWNHRYVFLHLCYEVISFDEKKLVTMKIKNADQKSLNFNCNCVFSCSQTVGFDQDRFYSFSDWEIQLIVTLIEENSRPINEKFYSLFVHSSSLSKEKMRNCSFQQDGNV